MGECAITTGANAMLPFVLTADLDSLRGGSTRLVRVPAEFPDTKALLSWYAEALEFPDYFGMNWDAMDECLGDLSWISERKVVLHHSTVPLYAHPKEQEIYLDVLARAVLDWKPGEEHELVVAFDPDCELALRAALRSSSSRRSIGRGTMNGRNGA
jgi:hypothetical protein